MKFINWIRRYPFTISLLAAVCIAAGLAQGLPGSLPADWSSNYGFAPRHIVSGDLLRLITSVFLTHDGLHFGFAIAMILLIVVWSERTLGSLNTFCLFSLSHLTSMFAFAIGVGALQWTYLSQTVSTLYDFHDVGPSAGYYGCLGALLVTSKLTYRQSITVGVLAVLMLRIAISARSMPESHDVLSADIVHLFAMLAGMAIQSMGLTPKRYCCSAVKE